MVESGKRDYSRPLLSEPDVKVSLHPAQASQRPCEGPVSMRRTCWLHDTEQQSIPLRGREHQCNKATVICHTFFVDSSVVLVPRHRREVCPLSRRVMFQPVSVPLQDGIRFFPPPYPHHRWSALRLPYFSCEKSDTGLPRFVCVPARVRSDLSAGGASSATGDACAPVPDHVPFGPSVIASSACLTSRRLSVIHMC